MLTIPTAGYAQNIAELKVRAEKGDVQAQSALGKAYHSGEGVAKDDAEAVRWWEKAAEQGDVEAQINLGIAYNFGTGVPKNYAAAAAGIEGQPNRAMAGPSRTLHSFIRLVGAFQETTPKPCAGG